MDNTVVTNRVTVAADFTAQATNKGLPWSTTFANQSAAELTTVNDTAASVTAAIAATTTFFANQFQTLNLTQNIDTPPTFATDATGVIFNAPPVVTALGIAVNTLNAGDNLQDSKADGTLNFLTAPLTIGANNPFAQNVTMNGIKIANITGGGLTALGAVPVSGFAGNITGLLVENSVNSNSPIQLGQTSQGLNTLLTDINISGYNGQISSLGTFAGANTVVIANAAADLTKTINISLKGVNLGTTNPVTGGALQLTIANDSVVAGTAANPNKTYGTWAITTANNANLELTQDFNGLPPLFGGTGGPGVGGATGLTLAGAGNIAVGAVAAGDWQLLKTIDSSKETGKVVITGNTAGNGSNAFATGGNPGWLFGSGAGLLAGTSGLTSVVLGSGLTVLDVSALSAAGVKGLTTAAGAGVTVNAANEIIVKDSVATTLSTDTFKNIGGFTVLGIGGAAVADGAGGTIDMKNLPTTINTILYQTDSSGALTINNQTAALTVNTEDNANGAALTIGAVGPAAGLSDSFHLIIGNPLQKAVDSVGPVTVTGDELVTITSLFDPTSTSLVTFNKTGLVTLTPTIVGNEQVTIDGDSNIHIGANGPLGAIVDQTGGVLNLNNMIITVTNTAVTAFQNDVVGGTLLNFVTDAGANGGPHAPFIGYSTNAVTIDASTSGGLVMLAGDANFNPLTSLGDTITGAANPVGFTFGGTTIGDILIGSIGNDTLTSKNTGGSSDFIVTNGGKDTITLAAGHAGADHVGFYAANGINGTGLTNSVATAISEAVAAVEFSNPGWWGIGAGGSSQNTVLVAGDGVGTSGSNSTLTGFVASQDFLDFSVKAWGTGALVQGLTAVTPGGAFITDTAGTAGGAPVTAVQVGSGGSVITAGVNNDFIIMSEGSFLNAQSVASALASGTYQMNGFGATVAATDYDMLLAYLGTDGFAHIADLHFRGTATATLDTQAFVAVSDVVTLVGVSLNTLAANTSHVHLIS